MLYVKAVLTFLVNLASILLVRFTAGFTGLDGKTVTLLVLWLAVWLFFIWLEYTIIEYGVITMAKKGSNPQGKKENERAFFINVPMNEQFKSLVNKRWESRSTQVDTLEKVLSWLLSHGKISIRDDENNNTFIVAMVYQDKDDKATFGRCVTVRHRNLEKALFTQVIIISEELHKRYADSEGSEGDLDW